jgi:predicted MFS family arabinose efflux permease
LDYLVGGFLVLDEAGPPAAVPTGSSAGSSPVPSAGSIAQSTRSSEVNHAIDPRGVSDPRGVGVSRGLARVLAFSCGAVVANLYYAQPLLHTISAGLQVSQTSAALLVTVTQIGYAAGLLLLVPVGDIVRRRPLFTVLLAADAAALAASAAVPSLRLLGALAAVIGLTSVVVQMLIPFAATLAADHERSKVIGTLLSGLLTGILLSRTFAGIIAQIAGWRGVYAIAALLTAITAVVLYRALPDRAREVSVSYGAQLRAVLDVARTQPVLRWRALIAAFGFAGFSAFWTTVSFLLAGPRYHFSQLGIGLFALAGTAGALASAFGGRQLDARPQLRWPLTGAMLVLQLVSYALIAFGGTGSYALGLALLIVGVLGMDAGVQANLLINNSVIYELLPQARSRITAVFMTTMFLGGAFGSVVGARAYASWGWTGATASAIVFTLVAALGWLATGRYERTGLGSTVRSDSWTSLNP